MAVELPRLPLAPAAVASAAASSPEAAPEPAVLPITDAQLPATAAGGLKPTGDWYTKKYVEGPDYAEVHVNNRIFFWDAADAQAAGYAPCPKDASGSYDPSCFASGS